MQTRYKSLSSLFGAAGSETRITILSLLIRGPQDLGTIIRRTKRSPSLVAHHLNVLCDSGWITKSKFGKLVTYYLDENAVKEIKAFMKHSS